MNVAIEVPALRRFARTPFTEPLALLGCEMIQNKTKMTTRKPTSLLRCTVNHHPSVQRPCRPVSDPVLPHCVPNWVSDRRAYSNRVYRRLSYLE
jgi:hypothetical protein